MPPGAAPLSMKIIPLGWSEGVKRFVVEQIQMAPSPLAPLPRWGEGKEDIKVKSLAPIGGEGGRRPGEGERFNFFTPSGVQGTGRTHPEG